jgi:deoxyribose-phosphate aldolase
MSKMDEILKSYKTNISESEVTKAIEKIKEKAKENNTKEVLKTIFNCIDLTSLNHTDTEESILQMVEKVNELDSVYPDIQNVAAICVYPSMVQIAKENLQEGTNLASVAGSFPSSQTFVEIKIAETAMCVMEGANEIDIVMSVGKFLSGEFEEISEELMEIKSSCREAHLKVIIESGTLKNSEAIFKASVIAVESGADFIKTSTGKTKPAATPEAAYVMCQAIKEYQKKKKKNIGFKAAGGIVSVEDAILYYSIVKEVLGKEWLNNKLFRIGASRLANNLLSAIYDTEIKYF